MPKLLLAAALLLLAAVPQSRARAQAVIDTSAWQFEELVFLDGTRRQGYISSRDRASLEFVEVVQPPGRPISLVIRPIPLAELLEINELDQQARELLAERIEMVRQRALIEAGRLEAVTLGEEVIDGVTLVAYQGPWFTLYSNADEETTRRCVVRIEQIFRGYRLMLPPRTEPASPLRIRLFGSLDDYHDFLAAQGLDLQNPAFYSVRENLIVAGGELSLFAENLREVRRQNEAVRARLDQLEEDLPGWLESYAARLRGQGHSREDIAEEVNFSRTINENELTRLRRQLRLTERQNESRFQEVSQQMFRRLYHEAFHAYFENYVFPHEKFIVPPWLNEGLALIFEAGQLDVDILRLDTPNDEALAILQRDLAAGDPLPLTEVLAATAEEFHFRPGTGSALDDHAARYYAYAWGLTWHLTMADEPHTSSGTPLTMDQIKSYMADPMFVTTPVERFENLVGMPLTEFEPLWQESIRQMQ